jgi:hypothetical protein
MKYKSYYADINRPKIPKRAIAITMATPYITTIKIPHFFQSGNLFSRI